MSTGIPFLVLAVLFGVLAFGLGRLAVKAEIAYRQLMREKDNVGATRR